MSATRKNLKLIEQGPARTELNIPDTVVTMALTPLDTSTEVLFAVSPAGPLQSEKKKISTSIENTLIEEPVRLDYAPRLTLNLQDKAITSL